MIKRVRIEISDSIDNDEIIIHCREATAEIDRIKKFVEDGFAGPLTDILLTLKDNEYIIPLSDVLFFESSQDRIAAHTANRMYYTDKTLTQLEGFLGGTFARASKSCIINLNRISLLQRDLTGICKVGFGESEKTTYVSRMYYKTFREKLEQLRLGR